MVSPHKYARLSTTSPEGWAICDRCGQLYNLSDLVWQMEWSGTHLYRTGALVCKRVCLDTPQEQLRTIILPPDPPPLLNARVPNYAFEEQTVRITNRGAGPYSPLPANYPTAWNTSPFVSSAGYVPPAPSAVEPPQGEAGPQTVRALQGGKTARIIQLVQLPLPG